MNLNGTKLGAGPSCSLQDELATVKSSAGRRQRGARGAHVVPPEAGAKALRDSAMRLVLRLSLMILLRSVWSLHRHESNVFFDALHDVARTHN